MHLLQQSCRSNLKPSKLQTLADVTAVPETEQHVRPNSSSSLVMRRVTGATSCPVPGLWPHVDTFHWTVFHLSSAFCLGFASSCRHFITSKWQFGLEALCQETLHAVTRALASGQTISHFSSFCNIRTVVLSVIWLKFSNVLSLHIHRNQQCKCQY